MTDPALSFIEAEIAKLAQIVPTPQPPFGYGKDLSCLSDLTATMNEVDPFSTAAIGEAIIRRLTTPRGSLLDDASYGLDLAGFANRGITRQELSSLQDQVRTEVRKDDRLADATVTLTYTFLTKTMNVSLWITPADPNKGDFSLVFALSGSGDVIVQTLG